MSFVRKETLTLTTTTTSTATQSTPPLTGLFHQLQYRVGTTNLSTAATVTVTIAGSSEVLFSSTAFDGAASRDIYPRSVIHNTAGTTVAGDTHFVLSDDRVTVVVDSAGASRNGTFRILVS